MSPCLLIPPSPRHPFSASPLLRVFLSLVPRHLPDQALSSKLAVEFWIKALTAMIYVETLAALSTEPCLMLLTNRDRPSTGVDSALHFLPLQCHDT